LGISGFSIEGRAPGWVDSTRRWLGVVELLIRFKALGFTLVMPLLGAATASAYPGLAGNKVPALIGAALSYHLFSYILNDVIDLPVDRTEPLRADYPLVKGLIEPWQALGLALVQIPLAGVFTAVAGGSYQAYVILGASFALMAAYNVWGKRSIFPPVTDLIQGLAWGGLTLYGAAATTDSSRFTFHVSPLTVLAVSYVAIFIVMINGIHGSVRDLANDLRCGLRTTAIRLGARSRPGGGIDVTPRLAWYTLALQAILIALPVLALTNNWLDYAPWELAVTWVSMLAVALASVGLLAIAARSGSDARTLFVCGSLHLVLSFGALLVLFGFYLDKVLLFVVFAAYVGPLLASGLLHSGLAQAWRKVKRGRL